ncbi:MAG TPA: KpsF/GutQ family sugar-phosphate isomerase [Stellaceae bacterium]|jgi:arabinose-5-phosphate isomerase|nr:KpsF/GutQ family sugar-phosphate isomerase [Stellaceae bacterium]
MDDALTSLTEAANNPREAALSPDLAVGRRVIRAELDGLRQLADALDGAFGATVDLCTGASGDLCTGASGRIIVTGMGKSGHIARKIAATFASTGTPAQFVHPAEASHGDLGMIGAGDVVLALSNSGNSAELGDIVAYSRRFKIPLVAITGDRRSTLAEAADVVMLLPSAAEACSMGLTPTTSTTMMLALGDALAVALLERKGFSSEDFQLLHPGGSIGRKLLRVRDIMHTGDAVPLAAPGTAMSEAILVMTAKSFGCVGVCDDDGRLVGVITDGDLRRHMDDRLVSRTAAEVMHPGPKTIGAAGLADEALGVMNRLSITSLFVVDEAGRPVGFLHMHDCLRAGVV